MRDASAAGLTSNLAIRNDRAVNRSAPASKSKKKSTDGKSRAVPYYDDFLDGGAAGILSVGQQIIKGGQTLIDAKHREQLEKNHANFRSEHPQDSRYHKSSYTGRNKLFKPKIRASAARAEAAFSAAFFSTRDATSIEPQNFDDPEGIAGARLCHGMLERHLKKSIRWKQTAIGALQDAWVDGLCVSTQYWDYRIDGDGDVTHDVPAIRLVPLAKFFFSPNADWRDPVNTSSYLAEELNPTVMEVIQKMQPGPDGEKPEWRPLDVQSIIASCGGKKDVGEKEDEENNENIDLHMPTRVFRIIVEREGIDYLFYMLGETHLLTAPAKLKDIMPRGMRNYAVGSVTIESHRCIPQSKVQIVQDVQAHINHLSNTRLDNVELAMNGRSLVQRDSGVDLSAFLVSRPGGVVLTENMDAVRPIITPDVTGSSFKEEEVANAAMDEALGGFSQQSANTNSNVGRTATGLELLASDSNIMTEYALEIFADTWMQRVLEQLVLLIQAYETDENIIKHGEMAAGLIEGMRATLGMLNAPLDVNVSVGVDATNPERKVLKLKTLASTIMEMGGQPNMETFVTELAGALGYDQATQFRMPPEEVQQEEAPDPFIELENAKLQQMQAKAEQDAQIAMQKMQLEQQKKQQDNELAVQKAQLELQRAQLEAQMHEAEIRSKEEIAQLNDTTKREIAGLSAETQRQNAILQGQSSENIAMLKEESNIIKAQIQSQAKAQEKPAGNSDNG